jgi:PAS domain S-box-containing protein
MNESIHGERAASEPQDRSLSGAHSIEVPSEIIRKWQEFVNLLAEIMHVPSASIMRVDPPHIKVFVSSASKGNPCEPGALDTGPYCETVMKTGQPLLVLDALENEAWKANAQVRLGMISYLGVPISWPDGRLFGTICVRDNKRNEYSEAYLKLLLHFRDMLQADLESLTRLHGEIEVREAKIRRLVDANIIGIFVCDLEGRILEANDAFLEMVGRAREDLISGRLQWTDLTPPEWHDRTLRAIADLKRTGTVQPYEKEYFRKDGSRVPVLVGGAAFDELRDHAVAFVVDLTERKRAEEALRQLEADLARMNRLSMMGELAASLAHEITQPFGSAHNNARAALNFLDKNPPDLGEIREALGCIVDDTDRAGNIIERIRDQVKKAPPRKDRFDLNEAINEVIVLAQSLITKNAVSVQTHLTEGLLPVRGDRVQLQQVVLNLILNAVEAMGSVESATRGLSISTAQDRTSAPLVTVCDSGPGIGPENLERIFEAFYTTKSSGLGMGLSICRSIVDAHGGRLWASANEPRGAIFQFTLPSAGVSS